MKRLLPISIVALCFAGVNQAQIVTKTKVTKFKVAKLKHGVTIVKGAKRPIIINHGKRS